VAATAPLRMTSFFAVVIVLIVFAAAYDLRDHRDAWPWLGIAVPAGVLVGGVVVARGRVADDNCLRGALRRTRPWVTYTIGGALFLNAAGSVAGGLFTGFVVGMAVPAMMYGFPWWLKDRRCAS
jgi:hypothetical protein